MIQVSILIGALTTYEKSLTGAWLQRSLSAAHRSMHQYLSMFEANPEHILSAGEFYAVCTILHTAVKDIPDHLPAHDIPLKVVENIEKNESSFFPFFRDILIGNKSWVHFRNFTLCMKFFLSNQQLTASLCSSLYVVANRRPENVFLFTLAVNEIYTYQFREVAFVNCIAAFLKNNTLPPLKAANFVQNTLLAFHRLQDKEHSILPLISLVFHSIGPEPTLINVILQLKRHGLLEFAMPELRHCLENFPGRDVHFYSTTSAYNAESLQQIATCWVKLHLAGIQSTDAMRAVTNVKMRKINNLRKGDINDLTEAMIFLHKYNQLNNQTIAKLKKADGAAMGVAMELLKAPAVSIPPLRLKPR